jgi:hypothetical protein
MMPRPLPVTPKRKRRNTLQGLRDLRSGVSDLSTAIQNKRKRRKEEEAAAAKAAIEEAERKRKNRRAEADQARAAAAAELDVEKYQSGLKDKERQRKLDEDKLALDREKFEFEKTRPPKGAGDRKPYAFEVRSKKIKDLMTDDIEQSPFRFGFEEIARSLSGVDPKSATFGPELMGAIRERFDDIDAADAALLADYMLRNWSKMPGPGTEDDEEIKAARRDVLTFWEKLSVGASKAIPYARKVLPPGAQRAIERMEAPQTMEERINEALR